MKFKELFDEISEQTTKTMCEHMAEEADVKDRKKNLNFIIKRELQISLWRPNSMIFAQVLFPRKLTYSTESRLFARNQNPVQKGRIWPKIGVLQLPLNI